MIQKYRKTNIWTGKDEYVFHFINVFISGFIRFPRKIQPSTVSKENLIKRHNQFQNVQIRCEQVFIVVRSDNQMNKFTVNTIRSY